MAQFIIDHHTGRQAHICRGKRYTGILPFCKSDAAQLRAPITAYENRN